MKILNLYACLGGNRYKWEDDKDVYYLQWDSKQCDKKFIKLCQHISGWSKDKNRKVGAVIVDNDNIVLSLGYNGIPRPRASSLSICAP